MVRWIVLLGVAVAPTGRVAAQDAQRAEGQKPAAGCFRGGPLPACRSFWITEASYLIRLGGTPDSYSYSVGGRYSASVDLGGMLNVSDRVAIGASASASALDGIQLAVKPRVRVWLSPNTSLDLAPGIVVSGDGGAHRFVGDASIMFQDRIGVTAQAYVLPTGTFYPDGTSTVGHHLVVYTGVRLGSKLGVVGAGADALALLLAFGAYFIACGHNGCD